MNNVQRILSAAAVCSALALAGCGSSNSDDGGAVGGGAGSGPVTSGEAPASAFDSVAGLIAYLKELVATSPDTALPTALSSRDLPVTDSGDPAPL